MAWRGKTMEIRRAGERPSQWSRMIHTQGHCQNRMRPSYKLQESPEWDSDRKRGSFYILSSGQIPSTVTRHRGKSKEGDRQGSYPQGALRLSRKTRQGNGTSKEDEKPRNNACVMSEVGMGPWLPYSDWGVKEDFWRKGHLSLNSSLAKMPNGAHETLHDLGTPLIFSFL